MIIMINVYPVVSAYIVIPLTITGSKLLKQGAMSKTKIQLWLCNLIGQYFCMDFFFNY